MQFTRRTLLVAAALASLSWSTAQAAETKVIHVYVKDMHCQTCAKKIATKLYAIPGVVKVTTDVKKGLAVVVPEKTKQPSPKAIWEAVEAATFEPIKLASPQGTFTSKPNS